MKHDLIIEWKHIGNDVTGTCDRCSLTGTAIREVLEELGSYLQDIGVIVRFRETTRSWTSSRSIQSARMSRRSRRSTGSDCRCSTRNSRDE